MLVRYQGRVVGFVGATRYSLVGELRDLASGDAGRRRVVEVYEWALEVQALTGCEPGRLPVDRGSG